MSHETLFVFAIITAAGVLMASNRVRFDIVALLVVLVLMLSGILTIDEALAGFGSQVVALVAGLLVIGEMLSRTGVARVVGDWVLKHGRQSETRLLVLIMGSAALLGSVMSSTVVVALFIPVVLRITAETQLNASRMLIPLSYASLISGMLTLIATTPNIVVHGQLKSAGFEGFGFFSFSLVGLAVLLVSIVYITLIGRHLLGKQTETPTERQILRSVETLWHEHSPDSTYRKLRIDRGSQFVGASIAETQLETKYHVRIVGVLRRTFKGREHILSPAPSVELLAGTTLLVLGKETDISRLVEEQSLAVVPQDNSDRQRWLWDISGAAVLIHPESQLLGKSLREIGFRSNYDAHVLGVRRNFKPLEDYSDVSLKPADSIFVVGSWDKIQQLSQKTHDFVVTEFPREHLDVVPSYKQMRTSLMILAAMVLLTLFNIVPLIVAVALAALAAVFTRCLTMEDAYRSIHWSSLVLIAGMLPLAEALKKTGGTEVIANTLMSLSGDSGPYMLLTLVFFLTASIGLVLSNTAAAVLVSPIAIYAATAIGLSPYPFAVAVVIAASSAFSTPVATPVVSLVVEPGRYQFIDFVKTGLPLLALTYLTTMLVTPLLFPF
ncbi:TRAP transporter large permease subunit [Aestuariicella hydrocarbonica]|uniref:TRAP transporter large permease subunit n=1 Tax=Pseudomaricurvus hydrocarbonicus TaxID=1470433 RepID=A0A9E5JUC2_9GAMM|nr:SLC13 family permease [Aestuariicella hydrocarbonica]NHO66978.1 TRAP transporter large permease subunit [Aestuariicella hydrocarbonica]